MGEREDAVSAGRPADDYSGGGFADDATTLRASDVDDYPGDAEDEAARLRAEIEQTRAGMGETIDAIQEKLSPENIKQQVKDSVREATIGRVEQAMSNVSETISQAAEPAVEAVGRAGSAVKDTGVTIIDTIRQNPLPAALIGLGVGMLVMNRRRGRAAEHGAYAYDDPGRRRTSPADEYDYDYPAAGRYVSRSQARPAAERAREAVGGAVSSVRETASSAVGQTREQVGRLGEQVQRGARRAGDQFQTQLQENPLAVGAVALALGAAVGLAVPSTRVENEYLGEARDTLVDKAQEAARGAMEKVQQAAQDAGRAVQGGVEGRGQTA
jgi:ElaB/YqjD/DUF883 family membrane-anchored ribosome-binding protein